MKKILFLASIFGFTLGAHAQTEAIDLPSTPLIVSTASGDTSFEVELADDPIELATGLMFRTGVAADHGMLFDFGEPREANMWMRNVPFSIDMVFLNEEGVVLAVVSHVQAESERRINPGFPVKSVLELAEGRTTEIGVMPGDVVKHALFSNLETPVAPSEEN